MTATPPLFSAFDRIYVVNLPERSDRRAEMQREFRRIGLAGDGRIEFFPAIKCSDSGPFRRVGSHGNFLARLKLLEQAAEDDAAILIFEDDCDFLLPDIGEYELPAEWDIFYGGFEASDGERPDDGDIIGSHFMGFSPRAAKAGASYLRRYLEPDFTPDAKAAAEPGYDPAIRPPIDGAFVWMRRAHPELVTVFAMLGVQRQSRTDVGDQRFFDRIPVVRTLAEGLRRLRRRLTGQSRGMKAENLAFGPTPD